ncbi:L,D-transpeptidase family protein [Anaerosalibacter bizertensis]|uniref:L,D-transpeptidase family protein n=1 Tax=Anaerosalibacter bizertensis TaxID=932217 RepID=A0A9Q4FMA5_9FIRM|nr:L,D-transpeptidase family protein [Anaerosalibacter bizertensis]MBU5294298.1 L,D-transpeptidase family protein [Anaerosalibacter bizertensis]MCB5560159.1 L,D-transpeptidase family protein [Anaerosalibacter bizertensis]MCG4565494.1 L,D-transpeptidase family protein [Anaerosalibacter bizertensis]
MKKKIFIFLTVVAVVITSVALNNTDRQKIKEGREQYAKNSGNEKIVTANRSKNENRDIPDEVKYEGEVLNTVENNGETKIYEKNDEESQVISILKDHEKIELLETLPDGWFKVKLENGQIGYGDARYIRAEKIPPHEYDENSSEWVLKFNQKDQTVRIYREGKLVLESLASGGLKDSFTPKGVFHIEEGRRGEWAYVPRFQQGMKYWVGFKGSYLFHSIPFTEDQEIIEEEAKKLGEPSSHGCIRLPVNISKYIYDEVPDGALVIIE